MTTKINGMVQSGQSLTGGLNFYTVRTTLDINAVGGIVVAEGEEITSQMRLDKLVETISTRAQPVILGAVKSAMETDPEDLPGASGEVEVFTLRFGVEHNQVWELYNSPDATLAESLDGIAGFVYDIATTTENNVSVTLDETL